MGSVDRCPYRVAAPRRDHDDVCGSGRSDWIGRDRSHSLPGRAAARIRCGPGRAEESCSGVALEPAVHATLRHRPARLGAAGSRLQPSWLSCALSLEAERAESDEPTLPQAVATPTRRPSKASARLIAGSSSPGVARRRQRRSRTAPGHPAGSRGPRASPTRKRSPSGPSTDGWRSGWSSSAPERST